MFLTKGNIDKTTLRRSIHWISGKKFRFSLSHQQTSLKSNFFDKISQTFVSDIKRENTISKKGSALFRVIYSEVCVPCHHVLYIVLWCHSRRDFCPLPNKLVCKSLTILRRRKKRQKSNANISAHSAIYTATLVGAEQLIERCSCGKINDQNKKKSRQ